MPDKSVQRTSLTRKWQPCESKMGITKKKKQKMHKLLSIEATKTKTVSFKEICSRMYTSLYHRFSIYRVLNLWFVLYNTKVKVAIAF